MAAPQKKNVRSLVIHVRATFNNTIITVTDESGNCIAWSSSGSQGFRGSKKATPYAATKASIVAIEQALKSIHSASGVTAAVKISGPGPGAEAAVNVLHDKVSVLSVENLTAIPFNGVRPRKRRRV